MAVPSREPQKMAERSSTPKNGRAVVHSKNGRAVVHPKKWPISRPSQKMAERSSTGVLNFRYFEDFFVTQDLSGGIFVGNELNINQYFTARLPTIHPWGNKNRVKNKPRNVFIFNSL